MTKNLQVSIIIAKNSNNPNCEKFLSRCLSSIKKNTSIPHEILVEDGANIGPARARNRAAKHAHGKYLFFLDDDTIVNSPALHRTVEKNFLEQTLRYLDKNPKVGGGQLKLLRMDRKKIFDSAGDKLTLFGFLAERAQGAKDEGQFDKVEPIFSCKGAAMIVRRDVFEKIGGFDPDYFMYWEEPDLAWRIWKAGFRFVFLPMGTVSHAYGTKEKKVSRAWEKQITYLGCRNQIITIVKNGTGLLGLKMIIATIFAWSGLLCLFLFKIDLSRAGAILRAFVWQLTHTWTLFTKRKQTINKLGQKYYNDSDWFPEVLDKKRGLNWYLGKAFSYITGTPF